CVCVCVCGCVCLLFTPAFSLSLSLSLSLCLLQKHHTGLFTGIPATSPSIPPLIHPSIHPSIHFHSICFTSVSFTFSTFFSIPPSTQSKLTLHVQLCILTSLSSPSVFCFLSLYLSLSLSPSHSL